MKIKKNGITLLQLSSPLKKGGTVRLSLIAVALAVATLIPAPSYAQLGGIGSVGGAGTPSGRVMSACLGSGGFHTWWKSKWAWHDTNPPYSIATTAHMNCFSEQVRSFYADTMAWGNAIYRYITTGQGDNGNGIIGQLQKIQGLQADIDKNKRRFDQEIMARKVQESQRIAVEQAMAIRMVNAGPSLRDCYDIPLRSVARATGGGGSSTRAARGAMETVAMREAVKESELDHVVSASNTRVSNGYCSESDVRVKGRERGAFSCSSTGTMPDGDARVQSLFVPAHNFEDPTGAAARNTNSTFDNGRVVSGPSQRQAANDAIANITTRFSPVALDQQTENTPAGKTYLAKWKVYTARMSASVQALSNIAARRVGGSGHLSTAQAQAAWNAGRDTYTQIYGSSVPFPQLPSEEELLRFEVLKRYADRSPTGWDRKLNDNPDPEQMNMEIARTFAALNYTLLQVYQRIEERNAVRASGAMHSINPLGREDVEKAAQTAVAARR